MRSSTTVHNIPGIEHVESLHGVSEYVMKSNGLRIVLAPNAMAPVVNHMVIYHAGSVHEGAGNTGSAHFFEHLMFKGTRKYDPRQGNGAMELFGRLGAFINANTSIDGTRYFACVPSQYLELAIDFEADRMRNLLNRVSDRDSEMTVVRNEHERAENDANRVLYQAVMSTAFSAFPYRHSVLGHRSDVEGISLERMVGDFYDVRYWPNNAVAFVVGDFDTAEALSLIAKKYGRIPRSPHPVPQVYTTEPTQDGERRVVVQRSGSQQMVRIAYHVPGAAHPDTYPLRVLAMAMGNSGTHSSRLYKSLIESGRATTCFASPTESRYPGLFQMTASLSPGSTFAQVEAVFFEELRKLTEQPLSEEELSRLKTSNRKSTAWSFADPVSFTNALSSAEMSASWSWSLRYDDNIDAVTADDVMRAARIYFDERNRTVGHFVPDSTMNPYAVLSVPVATKPLREQKNRQKRIALPAPVAPKAMAPAVTRVVLPNGMTMLLMPTPGAETVAVDAQFFAGGYFADGLKHKLGTAALTAQMLTRGSFSFSKAQLSEFMDTNQIDFDIHAQAFVSSLSTQVHASDLDGFVDILADALRFPLFSGEELTTIKAQRSASIEAAAKNTAAVANNAFKQAVYPPNHPHRSRSFAEALAGLDDIGLDDLRVFHGQHYSPASTILTMVGNIDPSAVQALIVEKFGSWSGPARSPIVVPDVTAPAAQKIVEFMPGKANVDIVIGRPIDVGRSSDDYFATAIASNALGQSTISDRLGKVIRVQNGLTYGVNSALSIDSFGSGSWTINLSVSPANVEIALRLVDEVVDRYRREGISDWELEDKITQMCGGSIVGTRSASQLAGLLSAYEVRGEGVDARDTFVDRVRSVTKEQVNAALRKQLDLSSATTVLCGTIE